MILNERLEHMLPSISLDEMELAIETKDRFDGRLIIKNTGGGVLAGRILSKSPALTFEPSSWEGNSVTVNYRFNAAAANLRPGESISTCAYISSNGGEITLPVTAKLTKMAINTTEGRLITNINDFYRYAQEHPAQAKRLFTDSEFYMLLLATGYKYMEVYENLHKDANRERAMDNFFILSGLKRRTTLHRLNSTLEYTGKPGDNTKLHGNFQVTKTNNGYIEAPITTRNNAPWLNLSASRVISSDFDEDGAATLGFSIDPEKIPGQSACETIVINNESNGVVNIVFRRLKPILARLTRQSYRFDDKGIIEIKNNTGTDMQVELLCPESYVRFAARRYLVGPYYEIPFNIKLPTLMSAQMLFKKVPYMYAQIEIRTTYQGKLIRQKLPLTVGEWK